MGYITNSGGANPDFVGETTVEYLVLPNKMGEGAIKVDRDVPSYTWRDITGVLRPDPNGVDAPTLAAFRGGSCRGYAFSAGDRIDCEFHIPHDIVLASDAPSLYLHFHWTHNGTAISGALEATAYTTYGTGHYVGTFGAEKSFAFSKSTPNIATIPRYVHGIEEVEIARQGGMTGGYDLSDITIDGLLIVDLTVTTIPTITGGSRAEPWILHVDLHYASTNVGTKNRAPTPSFWE